MNNMELWDKVSRPPKSALKTIRGGRLSGMTDISPQWRYEALTEHFGQCGVGWYYTIDKLWLEQGEGVEQCAFAEISFYYKADNPSGWSQQIKGIGGASFVAQEKKGPHTSDECYKMAVTDAISVAVKMLGFGAEIYAGRYDGSKYIEAPKEKEEKKKTSADLEEYLETLKPFSKLQKTWEDNKDRWQKILEKSEWKKLENYYKQLEDVEKEKTEDEPAF